MAQSFSKGTCQERGFPPRGGPMSHGKRTFRKSGAKSREMSSTEDSSKEARVTKEECRPGKRGHESSRDSQKQHLSPSRLNLFAPDLTRKKITNLRAGRGYESLRTSARRVYAKYPSTTNTREEEFVNWTNTKDDTQEASAGLNEQPATETRH